MRVRGREVLVQYAICLFGNSAVANATFTVCLVAHRFDLCVLDGETYRSLRREKVIEKRPN